MNRCLGIICSSLVGKTSIHFGEVLGYAPPWTMLDAQVYLGLHGISLGFALDGIPTDGMQVEMPSEMFSCSVGLIRPGNGDVCVIVRNGMKFRTPLIHAMLFRNGKWFDPQGDETLKEVEVPAEVFQLWPVYKIREPEGEEKCQQ